MLGLYNASMPDVLCVEVDEYGCHIIRLVEYLLAARKSNPRLKVSANTFRHTSRSSYNAYARQVFSCEIAEQSHAQDIWRINVFRALCRASRPLSPVVCHVALDTALRRLWLAAPGPLAPGPCHTPQGLRGEMKLPNMPLPGPLQKIDDTYIYI